MARNKSEDEIAAAAEPEALTLECPSCDNCDPTQFEHWETVDCARSVYGFNARGQLEIGDADYGDSDNEKFYCQKCSNLFQIPSHLDITWV